MAGQKIILYSKTIQSCPCYKRIFSSKYETDVTEYKTELLKKLRSRRVDAAVLCFCSASKEEVESVLRQGDIAGPLPVLACTRELNPEFINFAAGRGVNAFLECTMAPEKIHALIDTVIQRDSITEFFKNSMLTEITPHAKLNKIIDSISHIFPHRITAEELAAKADMSRKWISNEFRRTFGTKYSTCMRRLRVYQALRMMNSTGLDNTEIAIQLIYSDESGLARDFRRVLGCSPDEARKRLEKETPENETPEKILNL
jgi:AraC-like DNA-binding protein